MEQLTFWEKTIEERNEERIADMEKKISNLNRGFHVRHDYMLNKLTEAQEELVTLQRALGIKDRVEGTSKIVELNIKHG